MSPANKSTRFDLAVVGDDIASMVLALECARYGFRVALVSADVPARTLPTEFVHAGGTMAQVCDDLVVAYDIVDVAVEEWNIVGIPGNPFSDSVRSLLGWRGAWRIYLDRVLPLLSIGNEDDLERLVAKRIGKRALTSLVMPALANAFGLSTAEVRVDEVAPGLSQAVSRVGSLTSGVLELIATDGRWVQRLRIVGGTQALVDALTAKLDYFAVQRVTAKQGEKVSATIWVGDVACSDEQPSIERQIPRAQRRAAQVRAELLSDPENPPVGPVDLER